MTTAAAQAVFEEQLRALVAGGIDVVLIETMSDLSEVEAAVAAAPTVAPELPIIATLSFDTNLHSMMGVSPGEAVNTLGAIGVDAVGANCGRGPVEMEAIAPSWSRRGRTACCSSPSPTPGCRSWSATTSSTTPRRRSWPSTRSTCTTWGST